MGAFVSVAATSASFDAPVTAAVPRYQPRAALAAALRRSRLASGTAVASAPFDALPEPVLRVIMLALPVAARARAACVCRSLRAFLADPSLWQVLDLSPAGGVDAERVTKNIMRGAVARAAGQRACPLYGYRGPAARYLRAARAILRVTQALR